MPGLLPPRYLLTRLLSSGAFSTVYEAYDQLLERPVAFKILSAEGEAIPEGEPVAIHPNQPESDVVKVSVRRPTPSVATLEALQQGGHMAIPTAGTRTAPMSSPTLFLICHASP